MLTFIVIQLITINVINHEAFDLLWLSKKKKKKTIEDMKNLDLFRFYIFRWNLFYRAIFNELNKIIIILISTYNLKFINWFIIMDFYLLFKKFNRIYNHNQNFINTLQYSASPIPI